MLSDARFQEEPFVSVLMPVLNEERFLPKCLKSLLDNDYPSNRIEFIIVDGGSKDRTTQLCLEMAASDPRIKLLNNPDKTVPYAMNIAIQASKGEFLVRVDAHAEYPKDYIRTSIDTLIRTDAENVGGVWITQPHSQSFTSQAIAFALTHPFGVGNSAYRLRRGEGAVDTVPFGAFKRSIFEKVGMYQTALTRHQDYELNVRIRKAGGTVYLNPVISCKYFSRANFLSLWKQKFLDGKWNAYAWQVCPESLAARHSFPAFFVALAMTMLLCSFYSRAIQIMFEASITFYTACALISCSQLWRREKNLSAWLSFIVFPILHFGHGVGLLWGFATMNSWVMKCWKFKEPPKLEAVIDRIVVREAA